MSDQTLQALKALHGRFTLLKETTSREKAELQGRLDLATERIRDLEAQVSDLTKELETVKQQQEVSAMYVQSIYDPHYRTGNQKRSRTRGIGSVRGA